MKRSEVKEGLLVEDRWYPEHGTGFIENIKKTVFTVNFSCRGKVKYDYSHAQFLDIVR